MWFFNFLPWTCLFYQSLSHVLSIFHRFPFVFSRRLKRAGRTSISCMQPLQRPSARFCIDGFLLSPPCFYIVPVFSYFCMFWFFFSESPALQHLFNLLWLVSMLCIRLLFLPPVRLLFLKTCTHASLRCFFDVVLFATIWQVLFEFLMVFVEHLVLSHE